MRFEGVLRTWDDDRGFKSIAPTHGGQDVFMHIKAFAAGSGRPQTAFLSAFRGTVLLDVGGFAAPCSPIGQALWRAA